MGACIVVKITAGVNLDLILHKAFPGKERTTAVPAIAITAIRWTGFRFHGEPAVHLPIPAHSATGTVTKTLTVNLVSFVVTIIARIFTREQVTKMTAVLIQIWVEVKIVAGAIQI